MTKQPLKILFLIQIHFINAKVFERKNDYIPVTEIKKLTYKNRCRDFYGIIIGIPSGVFAALIAAIFSNDVITKDETKLDSYYKTGVIVGLHNRWYSWCNYWV